MTRPNVGARIKRWFYNVKICFPFLDLDHHCSYLVRKVFVQNIFLIKRSGARHGSGKNDRKKKRRYQYWYTIIGRVAYLRQL